MPLPLAAAAALDPTLLAGPGFVTLAYLTLYYGAMIHILRVKLRLSAAYAARGDKFDRYFGNDREMLAADRIQLNTLEHMPAFLALLWMDALFVSAVEATVLGAVYVGTRALYPFLIGRRLGRGIPARIFIATATGYVILGAMGVRCAMAFFGWV